MKLTDLNTLIENTISEEIRKTILSENENGKKIVYHVKCEGEPIASFPNEEEALGYMNKVKDDVSGKPMIIEKEVYESYSDMIEKLDQIGQDLEEKENMNINEMFKQESMYDGHDDVIEDVKTQIDKWLESGKIDDQQHYEMSFKIDTEDLDWPEGAGDDKVKHILKSLAKECAPHLLVKKKKENQNMENQETMEGNPFAYAALMAKKEGKKEFKFGGKTHDVEESYNQFDELSDVDGVDEGQWEEEKCNECGEKTMEEDFGEDPETIGKIKSLYNKLHSDSQMEEDLTGNQDKLDVDKDGDIGADDLADLRSGKEGDVNEGHGTCNECGSMLNEEGMCQECGMMKESKKKTLRLTETEMIKMIKTIVSETVPGLTIAKKSSNESGKNSKEHMANVEKKMKDILSFDGNDNPEFPKQIGKGEKEARQNSKEEDEVVADARGGGLEDLNYSIEPSEKFKKRLKMALEGDTTMGNSQDAANVVKSDLGKKIQDKVERKKKKEKAEDTVSWGHSWKEPEDVSVVKKESKIEMFPLLNEEIEKMKRITNYNKKTQ